MVGIISDRTKSIDRTLRALAKDYKRSNIKSVRTGEAQPDYAAEESKKKIEEASHGQGSGVIWQSPETIKQLKITPSIAGQPVGIGTQNRFGRPMTGSFMADHEKLKLDK